MLDFRRFYYPSKIHPLWLYESVGVHDINLSWLHLVSRNLDSNFSCRFIHMMLKCRPYIRTFVFVDTIDEIGGVAQDWVKSCQHRVVCVGDHIQMLLSRNFVVVKSRPLIHHELIRRGHDQLYWDSLHLIKIVDWVHQLCGFQKFFCIQFLYNIILNKVW
jgi:hypothetical protein